MNILRVILICGSTALCVAGPALAQPDPGPHSQVGIAGKVSTLGIGVDVAFPVIERANVRVGFNTFTLNHDFDNDGITLAASLKLRSFSAYFDFRITLIAGASTVLPSCGIQIIGNATIVGFATGATSLTSNPFDLQYANCQGFIDNDVPRTQHVDSGSVLTLTKQ